MSDLPLAHSGLRSLAPRLLVVYCTLLLGAALVGQHLLWEAGTLPVIWPTLGVIYATMLVTAPRHWLAIAAIGIVVELAAAWMFRGDGTGTVEVLHSIVDVASTALQALLATLLFRAFSGDGRRSRSGVDDLLVSLVTGAMVAAAGSLVSVFTGLAVDGTPMRWSAIVTWWSADFFAITVFAAAVFPLLRGAAREPCDATAKPAYLLEFMLVVAGAAAIAWLQLATDSSLRGGTDLLPGLLLPLAPWPLLMWLAWRFPPRWVALANAAIAVLAATNLRLSEFAFLEEGYSVFETVVSTQFYLCVTAIVTLSVAMVRSDRRRRTQDRQREIDFEELLGAVSRQLPVATSGDLDDKVDAGLARIGELAGARACSLVISDPGHERFEVTHAWHDPAGRQPVEVITPLDANAFEDALRRLEQDSVIETDSADPLAPKQWPHAETDARAEPLTLVSVSTRGEAGYLAIAGWRLRTESQAIHWLLVMLVQVLLTALRRREAERVSARYQDRLRALAVTTLLSDERTRRETASQLHDGIGQTLALLRGQITDMRVRGTDPARLDAVEQLVVESIRITRNLMKDLSPSVLHELGLVPALEWLAEKLGREHDLLVAVDASQPMPPLDTDLRTLLFGAGRELCTNALKHADAARIEIRVAAEGGSVLLEVADDGRGFDPEAVKASDASGFGLFSLRERLLPSGGSVRINSALGAGTRVTVALPIPAQDETALALSA